jgi:hypothetical protein
VQATVDDTDCVKVVMQFVVRLHAKKGTDNLASFIETLSTAAFHNKAICDIQGVDCPAHDIQAIEVGSFSSACSVVATAAAAAQ